MGTSCSDSLRLFAVTMTAPRCADDVLSFAAGCAASPESGGASCAMAQDGPASASMMARQTGRRKYLVQGLFMTSPQGCGLRSVCIDIKYIIKLSMILFQSLIMYRRCATAGRDSRAQCAHAR